MPMFVALRWSLVALLLVALVGSCSRHRYDYQQAYAETPSVGLREAAKVRLGDRYVIPAVDELTSQAPFIPNRGDGVTVPRPVAMHNRPLDKITHLRDKHIENRSFAEVLLDAHNRDSLRVDMPPELVARSLVAMLEDREAEFTSDSKEADVNIRTECALVYKVDKPVDSMVCVAATLRSSYVVAIPEDAEDAAAIAFGRNLLQSLLKELAL